MHTLAGGRQEEMALVSTEYDLTDNTSTTVKEVFFSHLTEVRACLCHIAKGSQGAGARSRHSTPRNARSEGLPGSWSEDARARRDGDAAGTTMQQDVRRLEAEVAACEQQLRQTNAQLEHALHQQLVLEEQRAADQAMLQAALRRQAVLEEQMEQGANESALGQGEAMLRLARRLHAQCDRYALFFRVVPVQMCVSLSIGAVWPVALIPVALQSWRSLGGASPWRACWIGERRR